VRTVATRPTKRARFAVTFRGVVPMTRRREDENGREVAELAALADGSLEPERRSALEARIASSPELADRLAEQRQALVLARRAAEEVEAPAGLRARVEAHRREGRGRAPRRLVLIGASVAAVLAVAVTVGVLSSGTSGQSYRAALASTDLAPDAGGKVTLTQTSSGWRVELRATGLPRLDGARFYQAWLRNAAGVLVPLGTFNDGRKVTLWAGVSPKSFPMLTVTREQANGEQSSSGEQVLVATIDTRD
jgi:anti-sigma-K factor RskA